MDKKIIEKIIHYGCMAPSGDNSQPWRFVVSDNTITIYNIVDRDIPFYNYDQKGSLIAHGALIENIIITAKHFGYSVDLEFFPEGQESDMSAKIILNKKEDEKSPLFPFIEKRITNRKKYKKDLLPNQLVDEIKKCEENLEDVSLVFLDDEKKMDIISRASVINEMTVLTIKDLHQAFFSHVVWNQKQEREKRTGLYVKTLEMPFPQEKMFGLARYWSLMKIANKIGLPKQIAKDNAKINSKSGGMIIFVSKKDDRRGFLETGRLMQRVWLTLTKFGWYAHPVSGALFLHQRACRVNKNELLNDVQKKDVKEAYEIIKSTANIKEGTLTMLLRTGLADKPSDYSSRLEPDISYK